MECEISVISDGRTHLQDIPCSDDFVNVNSYSTLKDGSGTSMIPTTDILRTENSSKAPTEESYTSLENNAGNEFSPPDGGRGWLVCLSAFYVKGVVAGFVNTFRILYLALLDKYDSGDPNISTKTAFIGSLASGLMFGLGNATSMLCDVIGIRKVSIVGAVIGGSGLVCCAFVNQLEVLYFSYGVLVGIGSAFTYCPATIILGHYFSRNLGIANGISESGSSVLSIIFTLVLPLTLDNYDIKYTLIGLGALFLLMGPCSLSWKPLIRKTSRKSRIQSTDTTCTSDAKCKLSCLSIVDTSLFKNRDYMLWCSYMTLAMFGYSSTLAHIVRHSTVVFPNERSAFLITFMQVASFVSRILFGKISDCACVNIMFLHQLAVIVMGITVFSIPFSTTFTLLMTQIIVFGICEGICFILVGPIVIYLLGILKAGQGIGFIYFCMSVPFAIGPVIAGSIYDSLESYNISFYVLGVTTFAGPFAMVIFQFVSYQVLKLNKEETSSQ